MLFSSLLGNLAPLPKADMQVRPLVGGDWWEADRRLFGGAFVKQTFSVWPGLAGSGRSAYERQYREPDVNTDGNPRRLSTCSSRLFLPATQLPSICSRTSVSFHRCELSGRLNGPELHRQCSKHLRQCCPHMILSCGVEGVEAAEVDWKIAEHVLLTIMLRRSRIGVVLDEPVGWQRGALLIVDCPVQELKVG